VLARLVPYDAEVLRTLAERHQEQLWPAQLLAVAVLVPLLVHWARHGRAATSLVCAALAALWLWNAIAWEWQVHGMLNWAGPWLGLLLGAQAVLLLTWALLRREPTFAPRGRVVRGLGAALVAAALVSLGAGGSIAGVTPSLPPVPVVALTAGVLLLGRTPAPVWLLAAPVLWSAYGLSVAWTLKLVPDATLLALAIIGLAIAPWRSTRAARTLS
jgi:hypothetical protein